MSKYIEKYNWLRLMSPYTGKLYHSKDAADELTLYPGWMKAFGEILFEELDAAINKAGVRNSFVVYQLKEKFGTLRLYHNQPRDSEIGLIIRKYEYLSRFVCLRCGCLTPAAKMVYAPWIRPMCSYCFSKTEHVDNDETYAELTAESPNEIPTMMVWEEFERYDEVNNKTIYKKFELDISDTVEKIKKRWEERVTNGTHIVEHSTLDKTYTIEEMREELDNILKEDFDNGNE